MKILLLPSYFTPEITASSHLINNRNEAFVEAGFNLEVITPIPTRGISKEVRKEYKKKFKEEYYNGQIKVRRFTIFYEGKNTILRAIRYILSSVLQFFRSFFVKKVDLIFVASTPPIQGVLAALVKKVKKVPFVYVLQDIFPDSLLTTNLTSKGSLIWRIGRIIENYTYRNADKIIVISEGFKKNIMKKGVPESKIHVVNNWIDEKKLQPIQRDKNILFERFGLDTNKFYVTYNGTIGLSQNMDMLLNVADMLKEYSLIHFIIMGEGAYKKEVKKRIYRDGLSNITLLSYQPYEEISHVFSMGNIGLVISKKNVGQNSVPSKTWSIMSVACPVVASFDENSELQNIIVDNHAGIFVNANDQEGLYNAILRIYKSPELGKKMGVNGRKYILGNLTREIGTSKYVEVVKSVLKKEKCIN